MSSDRTPADVIAESFKIVGGAGEPGLPPSVNAARIMNALAAAGFRVVPIPDDNTRAEVLNLVNRAKDRRTAHSVKKRYAIADDFDHVDLSRLERMADLLAAAYLDGQPQDRPATCPEPVQQMCEFCDAPAELGGFLCSVDAIEFRQWMRARHGFAVGGSGDTR